METGHPSTRVVETGLYPAFRRSLKTHHFIFHCLSSVQYYTIVFPSVVIVVLVNLLLLLTLVPVLVFIIDYVMHGRPIFFRITGH